MARNLKGSLHHESMRAQLSLAGWRLIVQGNVAPGASANAAYTVVNAQTRRVAINFAGTVFGEIRLEINAAATATDFPLEPASYTVVDVEKDDTVNFFNTSAGAITVYVLELD